MRITAKYLMALCPPVRTRARPRFLAGDGAAAFASRLIEKYSGIFTDETTYPSLVFLNNIAHDGEASMERVSLAVRMLLMKFKFLKETNTSIRPTINPVSVINKSYESTMAGIRIESPRYFEALTALSNAVVSGLNSGKKFIEIIYNSLDKLAKEKKYSDAAIGKTLMVFVRESGSTGRNPDFSEIERTVGEFFSEINAEYSESERVFQELRSEARSDKSDEIPPKNEAPYAGKKTESDENYEIKIINVPLSEGSDLRAQIDIGDFLGEKTRLSDEPVGSRSVKPETVSYNVKQTDLILSGENVRFARCLIALNSAEKLLYGGERGSARERLYRLLETAENNERYFLAAALIERFRTLGAVDKIERFGSAVRERERAFSRERLIAKERQSAKLLETAEKNERNFLTSTLVERNNKQTIVASGRLLERIKALGKVERIFERSGASERGFLTAALVERFRTLGAVDRIERFGSVIRGRERFFAREKWINRLLETAENNERYFLAAALIERFRTLGAVDKIERFGSAVRERERAFSRERLIAKERQSAKLLETAEKSEKNFLTTALVERFRMLGAVDKIERFGSVFREREKAFSRGRLIAKERQSAKLLETAEKIERSFLTAALVKRNNKQTIVASGRLLERIKTLGKVERIFEKSDESESSFLAAALVERNNKQTVWKRIIERLKAVFNHRESFFAREKALDKSVEAAERSSIALLADLTIKRNNRILDSLETLNRIVSVGRLKNRVFNYNDHFRSLNEIGIEYLAQRRFSENISDQYSESVDLNYKNEYQSVERKSQSLTKNELIERYGNLIDHDASKSDFAALPSSGTAADLLINENSALPAINKSNTEHSPKSETQKNAISPADADRLYDNFIRRLRQEMMLERSRFTG